MKVRMIVSPVRFEDKTIKYKDSVTAATSDKAPDMILKGSTNPETWKLMKEGYVVLKNYIPKEITVLTLDAWKTIEEAPYQEKVLQLEEDIIQDSPEDTLFKSTGGYCTPMGVALHRWLRNELRNTIDLNLRETYSYTRKYERGAYLKAHTDRPSCEISATICLEYRTDDNTPWKIWIDNSKNWVDTKDQNDIFPVTQEVSNRTRTSKGMVVVSLEPGDVLLYLGPNVAHWRDKLLGDYSYQMFLHFYNRDSELWKLPETMSDNFAEAFDYAKPVAHKAADGVHAERGKWGETLPLEFDGRTNRYKPDKEGSIHGEQFEQFMNIWQSVRSQGILGGKLSLFTNNYDHLEYDEMATDQLKEKNMVGESLSPNPFGEISGRPDVRKPENKKKKFKPDPDYKRPENTFPEPQKGG
jgi:hypothetical protein